MGMGMVVRWMRVSRSVVVEVDGCGKVGGIWQPSVSSPSNPHIRPTREAEPQARRAERLPQPGARWAILATMDVSTSTPRLISKLKELAPDKHATLDQMLQGYERKEIAKKEVRTYPALAQRVSPKPPTPPLHRSCTSSLSPPWARRSSPMRSRR